MPSSIFSRFFNSLMVSSMKCNSYDLNLFVTPRLSLLNDLIVLSNYGSISFSKNLTHSSAWCSYSSRPYFIEYVYIKNSCRTSTTKFSLRFAIILSTLDRSWMFGVTLSRPSSFSTVIFVSIEIVAWSWSSLSMMSHIRLRLVCTSSLDVPSYLD